MNANAARYASSSSSAMIICWCVRSFPPLPWWGGAEKQENARFYYKYTVSNVWKHMEYSKEYCVSGGLPATEPNFNYTSNSIYALISSMIDLSIITFFLTMKGCYFHLSLSANVDLCGPVAS